jgi:DNA-directed RNA polymerase subunit beta'
METFLSSGSARVNGVRSAGSAARSASRSPLDGGRFATSDLNDLYRRVISRNNRLKRLLDTPDIIVLYCRKRSTHCSTTVVAVRAITGSNKRPLIMADMIKGKQGRFGRTCSESAWTTPVVRLLPWADPASAPVRSTEEDGLRLFKPFIFSASWLEMRDATTTISAKKMVERGELPVAWTFSPKLIRGRVLLSDALTLHRLGGQAFEPVLIEGKTDSAAPAGLHSSADFVVTRWLFVPLTLEAQRSAH